MAHDLVQVLRDLEQELEEAERELVALQLRVEGLRETTDGIKKLMRVEREASSPPSVEVSPALRATPPIPFVPIPPGTKPTTSVGALAIIQSDVNQYWPVRAIWQNMVDRGWAADNSDGRSAVRIALKRLAQKHAGELERVPDGTTFAYRWRGEVNNNGYSPSPSRRVPGGKGDS